ncbi:MAG TPA: cobalamin-independent methionine synthase II family protein [Methylomirabilota bacterium]|nr:cobalamin-independent methionine synthase II family protein [Methylomirabilota bacterium]
MQKSDARILTTHVGSLPRNPVLTDLLIRQERGESVDQAELHRQAEAAVRYVVQKQLDAGVDIGNDGEQPRVGFQTYVPQRMRGFGGESKRPTPWDLREFPDFARMMQQRNMMRARVFNAPQAIAEVKYEDLSGVQQECALAKRCMDAAPRQFTERFMTAASPGIICTTMLNAYYDTHERYVFAVAAQMRKEYEYIVSQGFVLQLDAPDLAMERTFLYQDKSVGEFQKVVELHIAAMNEAIKNIPPDRVRLHVCWGNYDGPHNHDVPLEDILPILYQAKVGALSLEMANPRHQHEYKVLKKYKAPDALVLIPGVIDSTTNYVEPAEVVADRICQVVEAVGDPSRVIAGADCGFGTFAGWEMVAESVVWAKLKACSDGAALATKRLWG